MPGKGNAKRSFRFTSWIIPALGVKQSSSIVGFPGLSTKNHTAAGLSWSSASAARCGQSQSCSLMELVLQDSKVTSGTLKVGLYSHFRSSLSYSTSAFLCPRQKDWLEGNFLPNPHVVGEEGARGRCLWEGKFSVFPCRTGLPATK